MLKKKRRVNTMANVIKKVKLYENDMEEKLELEIEQDVMGKTCKFYFTSFDRNDNKRRKLTKSMSLDYLMGMTF
jgi:hypothetical protein